MKRKGFFLSILAATIFALAPIFIGRSYQHGNDPMMMSFFRGVMSLPILIPWMFLRKIKFSVTKKEFLLLAILGLFGGAINTLLLYSSYAYISVGVATTFHFIFPLIVTLFNRFFLKESQSWKVLLALILTMIGMLILPDYSDVNNIIGVLLAAGSGVVYAIYMIVLGNTEVLTMHPVKLNIYVGLFNSFFISFYLTGTSKWNFNMPFKGYFYGLIAIILTIVFGMMICQKAMTYIGSSVTSILTTFEPILALLLAAAFTGAPLGVKEISACVLIGLSIMILYRDTKEREEFLETEVF